MAVTKEFLQSVNEGLNEEQIGAILKEYDNDTKGLKLNNKDLLDEKKGWKEKLDTFTQERETEKTNFLEQIKSLDEQLKANGNEELKRIYDGKVKDLDEMYKGKLTEALNAATTEKTARESLYSDYLELLKNTELDRAMDALSNLMPERKNLLRDVFWKRFPFEFKDDVDGKKKLMNSSDNYKSIADTLAAFISTEEAKCFVYASGSGGGAIGATTPGKPPIKNPFVKGQENLDEQGRLFRENQALYNQLKEQAKTA